MRKIFIEDKRGFTLIEILLVIMIVGVLAGMSVNGYLDYRRATVLDFTVENFISQVNAVRGVAIYGDNSGERFDQIKSELEEGEEVLESELESGGFCSGFYFEDLGNDYFEVRSFKQPFTSSRVWNSEDERFEFVGCSGFNPDDAQSGIEFSEVQIDPTVEISSIRRDRDFFDDLEGDELRSDLVVRFLPPDGEVELSVGGGGFEAIFSEEDYLEFEFAYEDASERSDYESLSFNLLSARFAAN